MKTTKKGEMTMTTEKETKGTDPMKIYELKMRYMQALSKFSLSGR